MINESKKISLIANGITYVLLNYGEGNVDINITKDRDSTQITITQYDCNYSDGFLDFLRRNLKAKRKGEVEEYYWRLAKVDFDTDRLSLIGALIDESYIEYKGKNLLIKVVRYRI